MLCFSWIKKNKVIYNFIEDIIENQKTRNSKNLYFKLSGLHSLRALLIGMNLIRLSQSGPLI